MSGMAPPTWARTLGRSGYWAMKHWQEVGSVCVMELGLKEAKTHENSLRIVQQMQRLCWDLSGDVVVCRA